MMDVLVMREYIYKITYEAREANQRGVEKRDSSSKIVIPEAQQNHTDPAVAGFSHVPTLAPFDCFSPFTCDSLILIDR